MHLDQIRYVLTVAKYLSFSKASEYLFVSQSAISQSISKLEEELGFKFFVRSTKKVELTEKGTYSIELMRKIADLSDELLSLKSTDTIPNNIRLSVVKGLYLPFIFNLLDDPRFGPYVRISEDDSIKIIGDIKKELLTLGFCRFMKRIRALSIR
ncbi:LysR family transcriptional regulator [Sporosarcina newyorkensis 2681]|uniref:LysR family transcriptional regulator n=1 Tax=Sporosarcina newyorkensis 2681 TaxID=1027292 RepID=F9DQ31_9BACL|nr:LysR family transcriptional regulator [Sporosarcina newyorkensis]EGQ27224.1 LysR family transcriptional regulator [Sporosarcina newyorkensis 2681]